MGLRDLFRGNKNTNPAPQPSPGPQPTLPAVERPAQPNAPESAAAKQESTRRRPETQAAPLPESGALRNLVELLLSRGADRARLTLVQSGNIMTHQTRQAVGEAQDEVENGTVDQGSPLFDDVADLYTQAMSTPVGPWRQLDIAASAPNEGRREITVSYDFPNGESRVERYSHGAVSHGAIAGPGADAGAHRDVVDHASQGGVAEEPTGGLPEDARHDVTSTDRADGADSATQGEAELGRQDDAVRVVDDGVAQPAEDGDVVAAGEHPAPLVTNAPTAQDTTAGDPLAEDAAAADAARAEGLDAQDGRDAEDVAPETGVADEDPFTAPAVDAQDEVVTDGTAQTLTSTEGEELTEQNLSGQNLPEQGVSEQGVALDEQKLPTTATAAAEESTATGSEDLPAHVDESAFGTETSDPLVPGAATDADEDPEGAPQLAAATDVSPSYRGSQEQGVDMSALAPGNLTLTTGDVLARLAEAQRHLFGSEGTAREVSTVLIRVRALGTYYDALTHVRLNGFWDQRPTFDLVPEELLKVQELKDDSYVEGSGAPLAMMFRFRPGLPPEVTFDYSDEEAFVRYEQRLPGQNYLEELRMYPRTGSNIPQHVNEALQDWNY